MQGDSYALGIKIRNNAGSEVTPDDVLDVEITIGNNTKRLSGGDVRYENKAWLFPISQQESMAMMPGSIPAQVRVLWANGAVEGARIDGVRVHESLSREVL